MQASTATEEEEESGKEGGYIFENIKIKRILKVALFCLWFLVTFVLVIVLVFMA